MKAHRQQAQDEHYRDAEALAMAMAEAVRARIATVPFDAVGHVSASFGVATWNHVEDAHALIKRADTALYVAKSSGRNCVVQAQEAAEHEARRRRRLSPNLD